VILWSLMTRLSVFTLAVLLTACASTPPRQTGSQSSQTSGSRYEMDKDSGALEPIDLAKVRTVVPQPEPRTLAGNKSPYTVNGRTYRVLQSEKGYAATGGASWYGRKFHGHLTSNGEIYDMFQISAAHTTLPIPSYVRVTNLDNGKSIIARVNDRGPFHEGRILDLSYAGAVLLGYADRGTARVQVEAIVPGEPPRSVPQQLSNVAPSMDDVLAERSRIEAGSGQEFLQVAAFASIDSARQLVSRLSGLTSLPVFIHSDTDTGGKVLHKVRVGPLSDPANEQAFIDSVQAARLGTPFKVRI
jgi:rare lipoprotein A